MKLKWNRYRTYMSNIKNNWRIYHSSFYCIITVYLYSNSHHYPILSSWLKQSIQTFIHSFVHSDIHSYNIKSTVNFDKFQQNWTNFLYNIHPTILYSPYLLTILPFLSHHTHIHIHTQNDHSFDIHTYNHLYNHTYMQSYIQ